MPDTDHELHDYFRSFTKRLAESYEQITKRSREDPGTAGDQTEGHWAELLAKWLPEGYTVRQKGRLLGADGRASPQVDLVILKPSYPRFLKEEKYFLVDGVAAAFECKTTVRSGDFEKVMTTAKEIAQLAPEPGNTLEEAVMAPIVYGLLAHSHDLGATSRDTVDRLTVRLHELARKHATEPRQLPELFCIGDLAGWRLGHCIYTDCIIADHAVPDSATRERYLEELKRRYAAYPHIVDRSEWYARLIVERPHSEYQVQYFSRGIDPLSPAGVWARFTPVGAFIAALYDKLAYRDPALLNISRYFSKVHIPGSSAGLSMMEGQLPWPRSVFSDALWASRASRHAFF